MGRSTSCTFCASLTMVCLERQGDRALVHCMGCRARVWVPAILVDYRRERGRLLQALGWFRYKLHCENGPHPAQRAAIRRYQSHLADLRARLEESRRLPLEELTA